MRRSVKNVDFTMVTMATHDGSASQGELRAICSVLFVA